LSNASSYFFILMLRSFVLRFAAESALRCVKMCVGECACADLEVCVLPCVCVRKRERDRDRESKRVFVFLTVSAKVLRVSFMSACVVCVFKWK
jgi:hypothetical protein